MKMKLESRKGRQPKNLVLELIINRVMELNQDITDEQLIMNIAIEVHNRMIAKTDIQRNDIYTFEYGGILDFELKKHGRIEDAIKYANKSVDGVKIFKGKQEVKWVNIIYREADYGSETYKPLKEVRDSEKSFEIINSNITINRNKRL